MPSPSEQATRACVLERFFSALLWVSCLVTFIVAVSLYIALSLIITPARLHSVARVGCRVILASAGQRVRVSGAFPSVEGGPYIYVFNHTSLLDTFIMVSVLPEFVGAIGKREQFQMPLWGWALRRWGAVPISRDRLQDAINSLGEVERSVLAGRSLLIAPEGTRSPDGALGPFRKGPFHVALNTGAPVIPVRITGAYEAKSRGDWVLRSGRIDVHILEPVLSAEHDAHDVTGLRDEVRARFEAAG